MKKVSACFLFFVLLASGAVLHAQSPTTFTYQGRLTDGGALANGLYDFRLSAHDAAAAGNQVGSTLPFDDVLVTNGVFVVYPDFGPGVFTGQPRWIEVGVRPGASTGPYTTLSPRQPVHATPVAQVAHSVLNLAPLSVGGAQLAAGSVTMDKLAPSVAASLGGAPPSGAVVTAFETAATNLLASGYVQVPSLSTTVGGWEQVTEFNAQTNYYDSGYRSIWTGTELLVAGRPMNAFSRLALTRFNPAAKLWSTVTTNDEPRFSSVDLREIKLVQGGSDIFVLGRMDTLANTNSIGGIYNLASNTWRNIPTNGFSRPFLSSDAQLFWTGSELLVADGAVSPGASPVTVFNPVTSQWRAANTYNYDPVSFTDAMIAWTGSELLVYGRSGTNIDNTAGSLYRPESDTWRPAAIGPEFRFVQFKKSVFTGSEVIGLFSYYDTSRPATLLAFSTNNSWRGVTTTGMPKLFTNGQTPFPNLFWTGSEVGMVLRTGSLSPYKTVVALCNPAVSTWRTFTSSDPSIENSPGALSDYTVAVVPVWNGSEALAYLPTPGESSTSPIHKVFRFTPPRTLYFYQKP